MKGGTDGRKRVAQTENDVIIFFADCLMIKIIIRHIKKPVKHDRLSLFFFIY